MTNPTKISNRLEAMGLSGRTGTDKNTEDAYYQTFEIPLKAVASGAAQDTGIRAPKATASFGGYIRVTTAEGTASVKTIDVGILGGDDAAFANNVDVSVTGVVGPVKRATVDNSAGANFSYTLAGADFVELDAVLVMSVMGGDK